MEMATLYLPFLYQIVFSMLPKPCAINFIWELLFSLFLYRYICIVQRSALKSQQDHLKQLFKYLQVSLIKSIKKTSVFHFIIMV